MEHNNRKSVTDKLDKYTYTTNENAYIEVCEWTNGDGVDVIIWDGHETKKLSLSDCELEAIMYLSNVLRYEHK